MGRRGPRPKPTALKIASGTVRGTDKVKETIGERICLPEAPGTLGESGREAWERCGKVAESLGLLEERFLIALERFAAAHDRMAWAKSDIEANGWTSLTEKGYECQRPAVAIEKDARDEIRRYLIEFGWTPASAANVKITRDNRPTSVKRRERA
jgi:P27 family predicted phage terminase small subunit